MAQFSQCLANTGCSSRKFFRRACLGIFKVEILHAIDWYQMNMGMRHFEADDRHADTFARYDRLDCLRKNLRYLHQVCGSRWRHVVPVIDFDIRYHYQVAGANRLDSHDREAEIVLPDEMAGKFSGKNFGKYA